MDELSSARATAPRPIGATAKLGGSSGESADTNVSIAWTRRGVVPSAAAAASAPSSPISSRTLQMKITWCLSAARSRRRSAMSCAVAPTRSSNDRPVARVPKRRTYCFGIVTVAPGLTPRAIALARDPAPTSMRSGGGVRRVKPESRGRKTPATSPWSVCTSAGLASNKDGKNPPRFSSSSVPSSRIPVTRKPISSRCATTTTTGLPWPTRTHRLPAVSVSLLAQAGSRRLTASRTGPSAPETP